MSCQEGYPKLAIYTPPNNYKFPFYRDKGNILHIPKNHRSRYYDYTRYTLTTNELIVLVHNREGRAFNYVLNQRAIYLCYYVVPFNAIEKGLIPKTSIYSWKAFYNVLPIMAEEELTIVNKDELERQMKRENKYRV